MRAASIAAVALCILGGCSQAPPSIPAPGATTSSRVGHRSSGGLTIDNIRRDTVPPQSLIVASDGSVWYAARNHPIIVHILSDGSIRKWKLPPQSGSGKTEPQFVVQAPDGSIWFDYYQPAGCNSGVGHIVGTTLKRFKTSTCQPFGLAVAANNEAYCTQLNVNQVDVFNGKGYVTTYDIPKRAGYSAPDYITNGPDGNLWMSADHFIVKMTPEGTSQEFRLMSDHNRAPYIPKYITGGPDGNVWFLQLQSGGDGVYVSKITPDGKVTHVPLASGHYPTQLVSGPANSLWFLDSDGTQSLGAVSTDGTTQFYQVQSPLSLIFYALGGNGSSLTVGGAVNDYSDPRRYFVGTIESSGKATH